MPKIGRVSKGGAGKRIFSVSFTGNENLKRNMAALRREFPEMLSDANQETADEIVREAQRNIKTNDSYASGELYGSLVVKVTARGLAIYVGSTSHYAPYVEFGTRPHFPPLDAIRRWCELKDIPVAAACPIAKKIAERGTPEQPFLWPAFLVGKRNHLARVRALCSAGVRKVLGRAA